MLSEQDRMELQQWRYQIVAGKIAACIRGKEAPDRVAKYTRTVLGKRWLTRESVERILAEVEHESVELFGGTSFERDERKQRFNGLMRLVKGQ